MTQITNTTFKNAGLGMSTGGMWADIAGTRQWVAFMATADDRSRTTKRKTWHVSAALYGKGVPTRVTISRKDCFRIEAAQQALDELAAYVAAQKEVA